MVRVKLDGEAECGAGAGSRDVPGNGDRAGVCVTTHTIRSLTAQPKARKTYYSCNGIINESFGSLVFVEDSLE